MPGVVILAAPGPSLVRAGLARFRSLPDVLAVTSAFLEVPRANHVYACERPFWDEYHGRIVARHPRAKLWAMADERPHLAGVTTLALDRTAPGLSSTPGKIHGGRNSGYQAINLAKLLGYSLLLLVGFDMKPDAGGKQHFFGEYEAPRLRKRSPYAGWIPLFRTIETSPDFRIVNCTPASALDAFPMGRLEDFVS